MVSTNTVLKVGETNDAARVYSRDGVDTVGSIKVAPDAGAAGAHYPGDRASWGA